MGSKITIDSATMMNKGFEVIEAHYLFDIPYEKIDVILHKEAAVHSMVEYNDGSIIAQLGCPDMRLMIKYALLYPNHKWDKVSHYLDFDEITSLNFMKMDYSRYPLVKLAKQVGDFVKQHYPFFLSYDKVKIYYDNVHHFYRLLVFS